ncbi:hypothetical protein, partial [Lacticaseibacillus rhamnosus]|uniref:hypothetical protein n=1 Tax=Lacticaseibacillus rhamnosus TaxID=47715 RepID=UPI001CDD4639
FFFIFGNSTHFSCCYLRVIFHLFGFSYSLVKKVFFWLSALQFDSLGLNFALYLLQNKFYNAFGLYCFFSFGLFYFVSFKLFTL